MSAANAVLDRALANSTWDNIASCYRRFQEFRQAWEAAEGPIDTGTAIILWVSKKMSVDNVLPSSGLAYSYAVSSAHRHMLEDTVHSHKLDAFRRGLRRMGAEVPRTQAVPATKAEVEQAMRDERDPEVRLALGLMWHGAARCSDVKSIATREVRVKNDGVVSITWRGTKNDPFAKGQTTGVCLPTQLNGVLGKTMRKNRDGGLVQGVSYSKVSRAVKRVNPALTPHSLRRGAVHHLIHKGLELRAVQKLTRHRTTEGLLQYAPLAATRLVEETATTSRQL